MTIIQPINHDVIDQILLPQLAKCPLFDLALSQLTEISEIHQGLSQHCYQVSTTTQQYIAKVFMHGKVNQHVELSAYQILNQQTDFTAKLLWHSSHVILLEKLSGPLLIEAPINLNNKLKSTLEVAIKLHQLDVEPFSCCRPVDFDGLFSDLLVNLVLPEDSLALVDRFIKQTLAELNLYLSGDKAHFADKKSAVELVMCHGDLNFANVFYQQTDNNALAEGDKQVKLIDFECLSLMPREYDLAMLLAVNELDSTYIADLLHLYGISYDAEIGDKYATKPALALNEQLLQCYYQLALLINGLWYFKKYQTTHRDIFKVKAAKQFALSACGVALK